jgi:hypothetical protein
MHCCTLLGVSGDSAVKNINKNQVNTEEITSFEPGDGERISQGAS